MYKLFFMGKVNTHQYFTDAVFENGQALEERASNYLSSMGIRYKQSPKGPNAGIDFIIDGQIYMDCVAQKESGSIGDKLPTKIFKYVKKYKLKEIYILHPYSPITKTVAEFLEFLEIHLNVTIHILDWNDFIYVANGGRFTVRKPYHFTKDSGKVSNHTTTTEAIHKHFKF